MDILEKDGDVRTTSHLRAWWLTTFKGYELRIQVKRSPKRTIFGRIAYKNTWVLQPRASSDTAAFKKTKKTRHKH